MDIEPPTTCPECGADWSVGYTCQDVFDEFLILEFTDAGYGKVHFLTVACFMVQHGRYSDDGLRWIRGKLREHLEDGKPVHEIRADASGEADQSKRSWKVTRQKNEPPLPKIDWEMTITDIPGTYNSAEEYCQRIEQWGRVTLRQMWKK